MKRGNRLQGDPANSTDLCSTSSHPANSRNVDVKQRGNASSAPRTSESFGASGTSSHPANSRNVGAKKGNTSTRGFANSEDLWPTSSHPANSRNADRSRRINASKRSANFGVAWSVIPSCELQECGCKEKQHVHQRLRKLRSPLVDVVSSCKLQECRRKAEEKRIQTLREFRSRSACPANPRNGDEEGKNTSTRGFANSEDLWSTSSHPANFRNMDENREEAHPSAPRTSESLGASSHPVNFRNVDARMRNASKECAASCYGSKTETPVGKVFEAIRSSRGTSTDEERRKKHVRTRQILFCHVKFSR